MRYHVPRFGDLKTIITPDDGDIGICHFQQYKVYRYDEDEEKWIRDLEEEAAIKPVMEEEDKELLACISKETR